MKTINVSFEDDDIERIKKKKGERSWRDFIIECAGVDKGKKEEKE